MSRKKIRRPRGETRERVLAFVSERIQSGEPPSVREVQAALGLRAVQSAREHLEKLVAEGRLIHQPGVARGLRLPGHETSPSVLVPLLGRVAAGALSEAIEDREGYVRVELAVPVGLAGRRKLGRGRERDLPGQDLPGQDFSGQALFAQRDLFALRVQGESMRDAGILDGDIAIVRRRETANDGEIVVALVGNEATLKRLRLQRGPRGGLLGGRVELWPENPAFQPIVFSAEDPRAAEGGLKLLGRVIEIRRYFEGGPRGLLGGPLGAGSLKAQGSSAKRAR